MITCDECMKTNDEWPDGPHRLWSYWGVVWHFCSTICFYRFKKRMQR